MDILQEYTLFIILRLTFRSQFVGKSDFPDQAMRNFSASKFSDQRIHLTSKALTDELSDSETVKPWIGLYAARERDESATCIRANFFFLSFILTCHLCPA